MNAKEAIKKLKKKITPAYITKVAILTAISFIMYMFLKFNLPFFPVFLDMQFSELPAILAGFSMGPVAGCLVIILKCLLKFPFTATVFVGELTDMLLGVMYVLPASIIYAMKKSRKNAVIGLAVGTVISTAAAILVNRFISVPFYVQLYFKGDFGGIVGLCSALYSGMTKENFYLIYLSAAVLPFNLLRLSLVSLVTFLVYKRLSRALHWEIKSKKKEDHTDAVSSLEEAQVLSEEPLDAIIDTQTKESESDIEETDLP